MYRVVPTRFQAAGETGLGGVYSMLLAPSWCFFGSGEETNPFTGGIAPQAVRLEMLAASRLEPPSLDVAGFTW